jgi:hypothetical protein
MENYKVEIFKASNPDKNIIGWRVVGDTVEEVITMYEQIKNTGVQNEVPFKGNEHSKFDAESPVCPNCKGPMWDNRQNKTKPTQPDFKCKNKDCVDKKTGYTTAVWLKK